MTPCLVYSFGIAMQWEFDDRMADSGCEVHSFDPTGAYIATHEAHVKRGVTFHPWGLSGGTPRAGCSDDSRRFSGGTYGNLTGPLLSLDRIVRRLGIGAVDRMPRLKNFFARQAMGMNSSAGALIGR